VADAAYAELYAESRHAGNAGGPGPRAPDRVAMARRASLFPSVHRTSIFSKQLHLTLRIHFESAEYLSAFQKSIKRFNSAGLALENACSTYFPSSDIPESGRYSMQLTQSIS